MNVIDNYGCCDEGSYSNGDSCLQVHFRNYRCVGHSISEITLGTRLSIVVATFITITVIVEKMRQSCIGIVHASMSIAACVVLFLGQ